MCHGLALAGIKGPWVRSISPTPAGGGGKWEEKGKALGSG